MIVTIGYVVSVEGDRVRAAVSAAADGVGEFVGVVSIDPTSEDTAALSTKAQQGVRAWLAEAGLPDITLDTLTYLEAGLPQKDADAAAQKVVAPILATVFAEIQKAVPGYIPPDVAAAVEAVSDAAATPKQP